MFLNEQIDGTAIDLIVAEWISVDNCIHFQLYNHIFENYEPIEKEQF